MFYTEGHQRVKTLKEGVFCAKVVSYDTNSVRFLKYVDDILYVAIKNPSKLCLEVNNVGISDVGYIPKHLVLDEISEEEFDQFWTQVIQEINAI